MDDDAIRTSHGNDFFHGFPRIGIFEVSTKVILYWYFDSSL